MSESEKNRKNHIASELAEAGHYFAGGGAALAVISRAMTGRKLVRIATAYFEPAGYQHLRKLLAGREVRLLIGRPEAAGDKIREVIQEFIDNLISGSLEERSSAMLALRDAIKKKLFLVCVSSDPDAAAGGLGPKYLYHHAKLYINGEESVVVSSSNMTGSGLLNSREAGIVIRDASHVQYFIERFDAYYQKAQPIAEELLAVLEEWLKVYPPFQIYIRSLLEIYGLPGDERPGRLPELAGYQRPVVSRVLRNIQDFGGAFLVASTGLGKTIMAAHVGAYLRMENTIHSAIVICPAGLRRMWQRMMRAARISSREFSYNTLSTKDWRQDRNMEELDRELEHADNETLIIVDESHRLRNIHDPDNPREERLRSRRIQEAVTRGARILMMTATPYSKDVDDINAQLMHLPRHLSDRDLFGKKRLIHWKVKSPGALSETANSVVLTTPSVVRHFSSTDEAGEKYVLFSGNERRYFPGKIHIKNISYQNQADPQLIELLQSGLIKRRQSEQGNKKSVQQHAWLFADQEGELPVPQGARDPFFEARLMHQFCSSLAQADHLLSKMQRENGFEKFRFAEQEKLSSLTGRMRGKLFPVVEKNGEEDSKLAVLETIIRQFPDSRVVIFCVYKETAAYVRRALDKRFPELHVSGTSDCNNADELERMISSFAPKANSIVLRNENESNEDNEDNGINKGVDKNNINKGTGRSIAEAALPGNKTDKQIEQNVPNNVTNSVSDSVSDNRETNSSGQESGLAESILDKNASGEDIHILVATEAIAEGYNLQDANVLINFDLPWTVLRLAQRMGRILRPWEVPREVYIFNLIPSTMQEEAVYLALNWKERLYQRNREFSSFSEIPVIVEKGSELEMTELARSMQKFGDTELDLDQVITFIENVEEIRTSSFIDDLSILSEQELQEIRRLPAGVKSFKLIPEGRLDALPGEGEKLFLLLSYRRRPYPGLFDRHGRIVMESAEVDEILQLIRSGQSEEAAPGTMEPDVLDTWTGICRNSWAAHRDVAPEEVVVLTRMLLLPD